MAPKDAGGGRWSQAKATGWTVRRSRTGGPAGIRLAELAFRAHSLIAPLASLPAMPPPPATWLHHLEDEADAAFLYRELARAERGPGPGRTSTGSWPTVEDRHVEIWRKLLAEHGHQVGRPGRRRAPGSGPGWPGGSADRVLLPLLLEEEGREVKGYLQLYRLHPGRRRSGPTALRLAQESKEHAETLAWMSGADGEPWHRTGAGGFLRNVVYGFNDGLTANFGLVAGMIGAQGGLEIAGHAVVVAGHGRHGWPTRSPWARRAISRPRASGRCSSTRSPWSGRRSGSCRSSSGRS